MRCATSPTQHPLLNSLVISWQGTSTIAWMFAVGMVCLFAFHALRSAAIQQQRSLQSRESATMLQIPARALYLSERFWQAVSVVSFRSPTLAPPAIFTVTAFNVSRVTHEVEFKQGDNPYFELSPGMEREMLFAQLVSAVRIALAEKLSSVNCVVHWKSSHTSLATWLSSQEDLFRAALGFIDEVLAISFAVQHPPSIQMRIGDSVELIAEWKDAPDYLQSTLVTLADKNAEIEIEQISTHQTNLVLSIARPVSGEWAQRSEAAEEADLAKSA